MLAPSSAFALAGAIVQPTTVTASPAGENPFAPLVNMINQSGLSSTYTSGTTDFDTYTATATHTSGVIPNTNFGQSNQTNNTTVLFTFNLGSVVSIDALAYWISDTSSLFSGDDQDVKDFQLFVGEVQTRQRQSLEHRFSNGRGNPPRQ